MSLPDLPPIPERATLREWQSYVARLVEARGWDAASDLEIFLLFFEEVGELAKAFRRHRQLFEEPGREATDAKRELAAEMADVLSYLLDLAERTGVDLERAVIEKERVNRGRRWSDPRP